MLSIRTIIIAILSVGVLVQANAQSWKPAELRLATRWSAEVSPGNALKEYPRPQLVRTNWTNLNGLWDYAITKKDAAQPVAFSGKILVPYPIESALSGVEKSLQTDEHLWYRSSFDYSRSGKALLHFGAVDFETTVFINGKEAGKHAGGYTEFSFDITSLLKKGTNEILVKVWDPSDQGYGPHGKQVLHPQGIYYTPSSGIWQTVWLETVPKQYIEKLSITPDIDKQQVHVTVHAAGNWAVTLTAAGKTVKGKANTEIIIPVIDPHLWSPADPYLYDLTVKLGPDEVKSYFGMRKISIVKDEKGTDRMALNNKPYYNLGTLDQGFWPDGLYTAPTDEALAFDIKAIKAMGFNTIRKHIKVEPARWYYWADKLGMLVWQDFVNPNQSLPEGAKPAFEKQLDETIEQLSNHPSITTWVLFNEKWGQYDQKRLTEYVKQKDPSRLLNAHSGEILYVNEKLRSPSPDAWVSSDIADIHAYPDPMNAPALAGRVQILGEFGGIGVFIPDHQWLTGSAWGYVQEKPAALAAKYRIMNQHLQLFKQEGLSGSIYTQPFDVEGEQNGLMTYDREVVKIPFAELRKIHSALNPDANTHVPDIVAKDADLTEPAKIYAHAIRAYIDGKRDPAFLKRLTMLAGQTNDLAGKSRFGNDYLATLTPPYSADNLTFIEGMTKKVTDKGFPLLVEKAKSDRSTTVKVMNIIFADVIQPYVPTPDAKPDWNGIAEKVKPYGAPGEEIYLRAKVIHTMNQQDWENFKPAARIYLDKYGANIKAEEKQMFEDAIKTH